MTAWTCLRMLFAKLTPSSHTSHTCQFPSARLSRKLSATRSSSALTTATSTSASLPCVCVAPYSKRVVARNSDAR